LRNIYACIMSKQIFNDDPQALQQLTKGNMDAYRFLFDHHFSDLCNFLLIYLHSREQAEDVALDIFTFIWEKRHSLQINTSFKSFLFSAAKNKAITLYKKEHQKIFTPIDISESLMPNDSTSQFTLENRELHDLINQAILKLPEKSRLVYLMAWDENLSYNEIAIRLGLSPKTIENHVAIALRKLRESLKPYYKQLFFW